MIKPRNRTPFQISDQIRDAVDNSRRTIVVLSKNFLSSPWCDEEFNTAHASANIIVITHGDLPDPDEMTALMRSYVTSTTYLKHDDPWFWDKLRFRLPRRSRPRGRFTLRRRRTTDTVQLIEGGGGGNKVSPTSTGNGEVKNGQLNHAVSASTASVAYEVTPPNSAGPPAQNGHANGHAIGHANGRVASAVA